MTPDHVEDSVLSSSLTRVGSGRVTSKSDVDDCKVETDGNTLYDDKKKGKKGMKSTREQGMKNQEGGVVY